MNPARRRNVLAITNTRRAEALRDELRRHGLDSRQIDSINITF
jgi:hypothetical protein